MPRSVTRVYADIDAPRKEFSHSSLLRDKEHVFTIKINRLQGGVSFGINARCSLDRPYNPAFLADLRPVNLSFAIP
jgi:hypothetical protein